jgi:ketosteroid isomerase-like protein
MSQENVDVIRDQFEATNERDSARAMSHFAEFRAFERGYHFKFDEIRGQTAYLYTMREGKIVRAELFERREEALAAAGL